MTWASLIGPSARADSTAATSRPSASRGRAPARPPAAAASTACGRRSAARPRRGRRARAAARRASPRPRATRWRSSPARRRSHRASPRPTGRDRDARSRSRKKGPSPSHQQAPWRQPPAPPPWAGCQRWAPLERTGSCRFPSPPNLATPPRVRAPVPPRDVPASRVPIWAANSRHVPQAVRASRRAAARPSNACGEGSG